MGKRRRQNNPEANRKREEREAGDADPNRSTGGVDWIAKVDKINSESSSPSLRQAPNAHFAFSSRIPTSPATSQMWGIESKIGTTGKNIFGCSNGPRINQQQDQPQQQQQQQHSLLRKRRIPMTILFQGSQAVFIVILLIFFI